MNLYQEINVTEQKEEILIMGNMAKEQILQEVANSTWQPKFEFTDDLDAVVDSILKPHEDYFLRLHSKVKEIIEREIDYAKNINETHLYQKHNFEASEMKFFAKPINNYQITFADVCNWQKELFEYKMELIDNSYHPLDFDPIYGSPPTPKEVAFHYEAIQLPNLHINLGLRQSNVKVDNWNLPAPMFLENLKEMCFPLYVTDRLTINQHSTECFDNDDILNTLTKWYKIFQTIHFFEDLNGRLGGIVINILSYILTGKYLISKQTYSYE